MKTQQENEKKTGRKLSPPFLVKLTSGENGKHCDIYNHGSIHTVRTCDEGHVWVDGRVDTIRDFPYTVLDEKPEVKSCPKCKNEFETDWPFINLKDEDVCIRCYERHSHVNRDDYREALRKELKKELEYVS